MAWQDDLQPASLNGVPFYVEASGLRAGRLTAVHVFPFRSRGATWVEDLGLGTTALQILGFLIGEDVVAQARNFFKKTVDFPFVELVHPVWGTNMGSVVGEVEYEHRADRGRYCAIRFGFVVHKNAPYPVTQVSTQTQAQAAAPPAQAASAARFQQRTGATVPSALGTVPANAVSSAGAG